MSTRVESLVEDYSAAQSDALLAMLKIAKQCNDEGRATISKSGLMKFLRKTCRRQVTRILNSLIESRELKISDQGANRWHGMEVRLNVKLLEQRRAEAEAAKAPPAQAKRGTAQPLPADFHVTPAMAAWAETNAPLVMVEIATAEFAAWARSVEATFFDAEKSWQLFMQRRQKWSVESAERRAQSARKSVTAQKSAIEKEDPAYAFAKRFLNNPGNYVGRSWTDAELEAVKVLQERGFGKKKF